MKFDLTQAHLNSINQSRAVRTLPPLTLDQATAAIEKIPEGVNQSLMEQYLLTLEETGEPELSPTEAEEAELADFATKAQAEELKAAEAEKLKAAEAASEPAKEAEKTGE